MVVLNPMNLVYDRVELWENYSFFQRYGRKDRLWVNPYFQIQKLFPTSCFKSKFLVLYAFLFLAFIWRLFHGSSLPEAATGRCQKQIVIFGTGIDLEVRRFLDEKYMYSNPEYSKIINKFLGGTKAADTCVDGLEIHGALTPKLIHDLSQEWRKCGYEVNLRYKNASNPHFEFHFRQFYDSVVKIDELPYSQRLLILRPNEDNLKYLVKREFTHGYANDFDFAGILVITREPDPTVIFEKELNLVLDDPDSVKFQCPT